MTEYLNPASFPIGGTNTSGTALTVDMLTQSPTVMNLTIQSLVGSNQGYFVDQLLSAPGMAVNGGVILFQDFFPNDLFLDPTRKLGPRAPGAESPDVGSLRKGWNVARPQSLSGKIEVTDDARRQNQLIAVQQDFTRLGNSFADDLQTWGLDAINDFMSGLSGTRTVSGTNWRQARSGGVDFVDPATLPQFDFGKVQATFIADKTGFRPNKVVLNQMDALYLDAIYGGKLDQLLARFGLTLLVTPLKAEGSAWFVMGGELGATAYEKPLDNEHGRGPIGTWKDIYAFEAIPVFVVNNAAAIVEVDGIMG